jgi:hypothetical protein
MTLDQISTLVQTVAVCISIFFTLIFSILNLRKADAAERRTAQDTQILATQLEEIAKALEAAGSTRIGVRWSLEWVGGDRYRVENVGDAIASEVSILCHETLPLLQTPVMPVPSLEPSDVIDFMAIRTMGTIDATITVAYKTPDGEDKKWSRALPFKN